MIATSGRQNSSAGSKELETYANDLISSSQNERHPKQQNIMQHQQSRQPNQQQHHQYQHPQRHRQQQQQQRLRNNNNDDNREHRNSGKLYEVKLSYDDLVALHTLSFVRVTKIRLKRKPQQRANLKDYINSFWSIVDPNDPEQSNKDSRLIEHSLYQSFAEDSLRYAYNLARENRQLVMDGGEIDDQLDIADDNNNNNNSITNVYNNSNENENKNKNQSDSDNNNNKNITDTRLKLSFDCSTKRLSDGNEVNVGCIERGVKRVGNSMRWRRRRRQLQSSVRSAIYELRRRNKRSLRSRPRVAPRRILKKITPTKVIIGAQVGTWAYREYTQYMNGSTNAQQVGLTNGTTNISNSTATNATALYGTAAINLTNSLSKTKQVSPDSINNSINSTSSSSSGSSSGGSTSSSSSSSSIGRSGNSSSSLKNNSNDDNNTDGDDGGGTLFNSNIKRLEVDLPNLEVNSGVINNKSLKQNYASTSISSNKSIPSL